MRRATLTFDNGPTPEVTHAVLDVLASRGVRTTFFVIGEQLQSQEGRATVQRAYEEGHWIGNHTMTHAVALGDTADPLAPSREIGATQELLGELAHTDRLFRPWGRGGLLDERLLSPAAVEYLVDGGYSCVLWSSVPHDWDQPDAWVENCLADVAAQEWAVIVLHDIDGATLPRLPELLDALEACGVELVQELPDACVPVRRGVVTGPIEHLVNAR
jgi:peptidoglycan/xylan/chitin deacetylase (PgdA/CDA1 family)